MEKSKVQYLTGKDQGLPKQINLLEVAVESSLMDLSTGKRSTELKLWMSRNMNGDIWVGGISRTESKVWWWHLWATVFCSDTLPDNLLQPVLPPYTDTAPHTYLL